MIPITLTRRLFSSETAKYAQTLSRIYNLALHPPKRHVSLFEMTTLSAV